MLFKIAAIDSRMYSTSWQALQQACWQIEGWSGFVPDTDSLADKFWLH